MRILDRVQEVVRDVVHTRDDVAVPLDVGGPENDDTVQIIGGPEFANVGMELVEVNLLVIPGDEVICASLLVGGDEVRVVNGGEGFAHVSHEAGELALEIPRENLDTSHSLVKRETGNIPSAENKVVGVNHGQYVTARDIDIPASDGSTPKRMLEARRTDPT